MTSFASAKGPSVTLGFPPANDTRAPIEGGWRPSSASSTPAFCSSSLYFIIAATALASGMVPGAAVSYPLGIISIMNRIVTPPSGFAFGARLRRLRPMRILGSVVLSNKGPRDRHEAQNFLRRGGTEHRAGLHSAGGGKIPGYSRVTG